MDRPASTPELRLAPAIGEPMTSKPNDLLTVAEVLAELRIPRRTWQRWRELGTGPQCVRLPNRELRVRRSILSDWLENLQEAA